MLRTKYQALSCPDASNLESPYLSGPAGRNQLGSDQGARAAGGH